MSGDRLASSLSEKCVIESGKLSTDKAAEGGTFRRERTELRLVSCRPCADLECAAGLHINMRRTGRISPSWTLSSYIQSYHQINSQPAIHSLNQAAPASSSHALSSPIPPAPLPQRSLSCHRASALRQQQPHSASLSRPCPSPSSVSTSPLCEDGQSPSPTQKGRGYELARAIFDI